MRVVPSYPIWTFPMNKPTVTRGLEYLNSKYGNAQFKGLNFIISDPGANVL